MPRTEAERRHHRRRVIRNRMRLIRDKFDGEWGLDRRGPGALSKDHLTDCSCFLCKPHKYLPARRYGGRVVLDP